MTTSHTLLILGASGDLTERLLLPGLGSLIAGGVEADKELISGLRILGSGRSERSRDEWQKTVATALDAVGAKGADARQIIADADYVVADPTSKDDLAGILGGVEGALVIYFALPPAIVVKVIDTLAKVELPGGTVLALEKPFASDARSAATLNRHLLKLVPEEQIHRVDHFLGMSTVLNILGLRFVNRLVEPIWNNQNVEKVEIIYDEDLGLEGRAGYYDSSGALIDMLQSHLLQVLSIVAMEAPTRIDPVDFRAATAAVLRATSVWSGVPQLQGTDAVSRRARYTAGTVGTRKMPSYASEEGVDPSRETETLAEMVVSVDTRRWAGVPFALRSGKAIGEPVKQVVLTLKPVGFVPAGLTGAQSRERLVIGLKPETLTFELTLNGDDDPFSLERHDLTTELAPSPLTAYGEVMRGVLGSDPTLSIRGDVAEQCWRIVAPVLNAWKRGDVPLEEYAAGSQGPSSWSHDVTE
ncbi:glucose-6-phosphate dehydrogenase [Subtercola boreus]|uniref:Glucose-6-phosphate dehydrogenase n=1 Tax=Subtercola boreus TaxID=120213 RepID=A0A3E0WBS8_9MICO|nr:glucose-6-phosphate dehydrogenase [Subtercola boreus]RFA21041.1 glucose-6-phosphate dehydrogenase [Subtercola boreus]RFA21425.1 glucose-6-phosphate dehydrogenase [Subtercola boreus]RFA27396.1 glucose-6-phosphate dehydrogenase [Subtercola boreus]